MEPLMTNQTVFITGAAGGIGFATARLMLQENARAVMLTDINEAVTTAAGEKLRAEFPAAQIYTAWPDLTDQAQVGDSIRRFAGQVGRLDAVCAIAGITHNFPIQRMPEGEFERQISVNLLGTYYVDRQAALVMMEQGGGSIVNTSSICGLYGNPMGCGYGAAKGAVIGLTKSLGRELGPCNVRVNCVAPGAIKTPMTASLSPQARQAAEAGIALGRMGTAEEVANLYLFLASGLSSYCTAGVYHVDGFSI